MMGKQTTFAVFTLEVKFFFSLDESMVEKLAIYEWFFLLLEMALVNVE